MNLVIVESPAKGRTIKKILGQNYEVMASFGHVRDLPAKKIGVDLKNNFEPEYEIPAKARKVIASLKAEAKKAERVYLATDYDREGEAIAWHIVQATGLDKGKSHRITFHEITKPAVLEAIKHPRELNLSLVDAQQARRILDRLVGYKLSPFLWQKVAQGLSAGRVQSVAVRLVVEREREIRNFKPQEYWQIEAILTKKTAKAEFKAQLAEIDGQKVGRLGVKEANQAKEIADNLEKATYEVAAVEEQAKTRYPAPPFTTSTLQQEAARKFGYSAKKTMKLAQDLYEDGLITYMRTDSVQVSGLALKSAKEVLTGEYGPEYALEAPRFYKVKAKGAQEAHEAIRPTNLALKTAGVQTDQQKIYHLIRQRMLASQAKEAQVLETTAKIKADKYQLEAVGNQLKFDGYLKIYGRTEENFGQKLPHLAAKEPLNLIKIENNQHFTEPPARYTEGTLVKELEKRGIGRPSTYAPTISTIIDRGYVEKDSNKLQPKEIGEVVNDLLVEHFPQVVDYNFTAKMEEDLDAVAEGAKNWQKILSDFYGPFSQNLAQKLKDVSKKAITEEETDEKCPKCGKNLKIKLGRFGKFLACSGFPECKHTQPYLDSKNPQINHAVIQETNEKCPKCGKNMVLKEGRFGKFLACSGYPDCKTTKNIQVTSPVPCPNCGAKLVQKRTKKGKPFWGCSGYPKCQTAFWDEPQKEKCPKCGAVVTLNQKSKVLKCSQCEYKKTQS